MVCHWCGEKIENPDNSVKEFNKSFCCYKCAAECEKTACEVTLLKCEIQEKQNKITTHGRK